MKKTLRLTETELKGLIKKMVYEVLKPSQFRKYASEFDKEKYSEIFKTLGDKYSHDRNYYRIYIPLQSSSEEGPVSETQKEVTKFLEDNSYKVLDYVKGNAKYGESKNITTIGKALTRLKADALMKKFVSDESRKALTSDASNLLVVISRHPYDIAGSDTDRNWTNCMTMGHSDSPRVVKLNDELKELQYKLELLEAEYSNTPGFTKTKSSPVSDEDEENYLYVHTKEFLSSPLYKVIKRIDEINKELEERKEEGQNAKYLIHDVKEGSLISYLIRSDDKNIQNPIAVLNIKPYVDEHGYDFILVSDNNMYGQGRPEFKSTVDSVLKEINGENVKGGYYCLNKNIYNDSGNSRIFVSDIDLDKFITASENYFKTNVRPIIEWEYNRQIHPAIDSAFDAYSSEYDMDMDEFYEHENEIIKYINSKKQNELDYYINTGDYQLREEDVYYSYDLFKKIYPKDKDNVDKFVKYHFGLEEKDGDERYRVDYIDENTIEDMYLHIYNTVFEYLQENFPPEDIQY